MNWFEITLIDGTRGLLNLDNVVDIWKGLDLERFRWWLCNY